MAHDSCEVLIVGAGPAGVVTSMLLGDLGIDCLIVDKRTAVSPLPRARGIHARATEILRQLGVEGDMVAAALPVGPRMEIRGPLNEPPATVIPTGGSDFDEVSPCEGIAVAQDLFETVLREHLRHRPTVRLRLGLDATAVEVKADGSVVTTVRDPAQDSAHTVQAAYVVAADGWRSKVRTWSGIPFHGEESLASLRGVLFRADLTAWLGDPPPAFIQLTHVPGVLFPTHADHRWASMRFVGAAGPGPTDPADFVRTQLGVDITVEPLGDTIWSVGVQWAETMQQGRVFLVGDAAHRVTPQGAGGISAAMADAHNLAWKLGATLRGWGGPRLLESYTPERGAVTRAICAANRTMWEAMSARPSGPGPAQVDLRSLDMGYRYDSEIIVGRDDLPALDPEGSYTPAADPGSRAPHAWLDDRRRRSILDHFGPHFVLISPEHTPWPAAATTVASESRIPLTSYPTANAEVLAAYDLDDGAVLVRPDGHVAWRSHSAGEPLSLLRHALSAASGHLPSSQT